MQTASNYLLLLSHTSDSYSMTFLLPLKTYRFLDLSTIIKFYHVFVPYIIIYSSTEKDEPSSSAIMAVLSSEDGPKVVRAPPVGPEEAKAVLTACAATYSKTGAACPPESAVKAVQKCTLPLYAKVREKNC